MSTRLHRQKYIQQKKERRKNKISNAEARRKVAAQHPEPEKPLQSALSKRWISEAPSKGRCSKLEAIFRIQDESEQGKSVAESMESLARLANDSEAEVAGSAACAAGTCIRNGESPALLVQPLINLLHSKEDFVVEAAIESLGECAKKADPRTRKIIVNKVIAINRNGASHDTKSNAGFALSEAFSCAPEMVLDREIRRLSKSCFLKMLSSGNYQCKVAGATGIAHMAIALSKHGRAGSENANSLLRLHRIECDELMSEVFLKSVFLAYLNDPASLSPAILKASVLSLSGAVCRRNIELARNVLECGLEQKEGRIHLMELIFAWALRSRKAESSFDLPPQMQEMVSLKRKTFEELIEYGRRRFAEEGKRVHISFNM